METLNIHYLFEITDLSKSELIKELIQKYEGLAFNSEFIESICSTYSNDQRFIVLSQTVKSMEIFNQFCKAYKKVIDKIFIEDLIESKLIQVAHIYITF